MIFCTIGTQAPFDRFVRIVDEVAAYLNEEVQYGQGGFTTKRRFILSY